MPPLRLFVIVDMCEPRVPVRTVGFVRVSSDRGLGKAYVSHRRMKCLQGVAVIARAGDWP
jgi:hypothetical protein